MNNLEKELEEIFEMIGGSGNANKLRAQCAAKQCMKWIQDGFHFAYDKGERGDGRGSATEYNEYLSERGLTPTEPDTKEPKI